MEPDAIVDTLDALDTLSDASVDANSESSFTSLALLLEHSDDTVESEATAAALSFASSEFDSEFFFTSASLPAADVEFASEVDNTSSCVCDCGSCVTISSLFFVSFDAASISSA